MTPSSNLYARTALSNTHNLTAVPARHGWTSLHLPSSKASSLKMADQVLKGGRIIYLILAIKQGGILPSQI